MNENACTTPKIQRRTRLTWASYKEFGLQLHDKRKASPSTKARILKGEFLEILLYATTNLPYHKQYIINR